MVKCNIEKNSILNMKINVKFNLNHENLTFKFLAFWLKNRSGFFTFIHKRDYRTLKMVRITLKNGRILIGNFTHFFYYIFNIKT